jgi:hypothetical protein
MINYSFEEKKMPTDIEEDISTLITLELPSVGKETLNLRAVLPGQPIALPSLRFPLPVLRLPWLAEALKEQGGKR